MGHVRVFRSHKIPKRVTRYGRYEIAYSKPISLEGQDILKINTTWRKRPILLCASFLFERTNMHTLVALVRCHIPSSTIPPSGRP